jgi:hypothetical protein
MALNIPIKASDAEARAMIAQKLAKDKNLTMSDKRQLEDQYNSYSKGYAKGGAVKKDVAKKSPAKGATWDGVKDHEFGFTIGQSGSKELMGNRQPKPGPKVDLNITIKKTKFADGGMVSPKLSPKQTKKVGSVMHEFKTGTLHIGKGGKVVKDPKQGIAIALSEASRMKKK